MKILFRISKLGFGGAEQVFLSIAREFQRQYDHEIVFIVDSDVGVNVQLAKQSGFEVVSLQAKRTLSSIIPFSKLINQLAPDVIISAYTDTNAACLLSSSIARHKVPVIVSEHAALHEHWQKKSPLKKRILKFYVSWIYKLADKVLCVSKGLEKQVNVLLNQEYKTTTIYNPVRFDGTTDVSDRIEQGILQLVAVGRVVPQKDYATLIKAVALVKEHTAVQLKIVGGTKDVAEFDNVKSLISLYQLEKEVEFVGYTDSVADYYKGANIFVLSSAWEGFGNVIVEAMAFGLPVVTTNCNYGPAEILENGKYGRLVDVGDSRALAKAILAENTNPTVNSDTLVARSQDFSEKRIAGQYYQLICEVVKNGS